MKNFVSEGKTVTFTAGAAYTSGDVVPLGKMAGIAANDIANGAVGVAVIEGEFNLAKTTGTAYAIGDLLDWDVSAAKLGKAITPASGDIEDFCVAMEAAASGATTCRVKLVQGLATVN